MKPRDLCLFLALSLAACGSQQLPPPSRLVPTSDPVTRLVRNDATRLLGAGAASLRQMGFDIAERGAATSRVYTEPLVLQHRWRGEPISERILCGIGTAATSDPLRLTQVANTIPIQLRLGFEVEPRAEMTAVTVIFIAQGRRVDGVIPPSDMSCTLTVPFVNELFAALETQLEEIEQAGIAAGGPR